jgi:hypothetical protein
VPFVSVIAKKTTLSTLLRAFITIRYSAVELHNSEFPKNPKLTADAAMSELQGSRDLP